MSRLDARLRALEALEQAQDDRMEIVETYVRPNGTHYSYHYVTSRTEEEAWRERKRAELEERMARLDFNSVDPSRDSINDLLAAGYYAEIVRRVDTWYQRTSMALPLALVQLADALRPEVAAGRTHARSAEPPARNPWHKEV